MLIPTAALTATIPYARMALGAFVAAGAWCTGQYVTARALRRMDPGAFSDGKPEPLSREEKIRNLQLMLLTTAAGDAGSMTAAMQDPDTLTALRAMDRVAKQATPLLPANANDGTAAPMAAA